MESTQIKRRLLFLSPSVKSGIERECTVDDFVSLSERSIGKGAFGEVYKVKHKISGELFAIKVISKNRIVSRGLLPQIRREVRIMYSLSHPNIIKLYNHFEDDDNFYLIMEIAEGGSLFKVLRKRKTLDERSTAQYMREVSLAVQYLHQRYPPIIHRDIKPENILLDADDIAKLSDFGWSNFNNDERDTYCGTLEYLAPEMIARTGHGIELDLWNLGILLFELLAGRPPFESKSQTELLLKIQKNKIGFPKNFPVLAKDLVRRLLRTNPKERLNIEQLFEHPWMRAHAQLRPTIELTKAVEPLPLLSDSSDPSFQSYEYKVISKPYTPKSTKPATPTSSKPATPTSAKPATPTLAKPTTPKAPTSAKPTTPTSSNPKNSRFRDIPYKTAPPTANLASSPKLHMNSSPSSLSQRERRIEIDLNDKKSYLSYLEAKLANTKKNIEMLDTSITKLNQEVSSISTAAEIDKLKSSIGTYKSEKEKNNQKCIILDRHVKAKTFTVIYTQLEDLSNKLNMTAYSTARLQSLYTNLRSQQNLILSLSSKISAPSSINITQRLLILLKRQYALSLSFNHEDFKAKLQVIIEAKHPLEIEIHILEGKLKGSRESIRTLQLDWKELQPVLQLKRDVKKLFYVFYNSKYV